VFAQSSGVQASGTVNPHAQQRLEEKGLWRESYHSKVIETLIDLNFDLVVTVCDHAHETCPVFENATQKQGMSFDDPSAKASFEYEKTLDLIEAQLLPAIKTEFC